MLRLKTWPGWILTSSSTKEIPVRQILQSSWTSSRQWNGWRSNLFRRVLCNPCCATTRRNTDDIVNIHTAGAEGATRHKRLQRLKFGVMGLSESLMLESKHNIR
jgi:hypothetical protein